MNARRVLSWIVPVLALSGACSVGEPLVDRFPPPPRKDGAAVRCSLPADCAIPLVLELTQPVAMPLQWQTCSEACEGTLVPEGAIGTGDDDVAVLGCAPVEPLESLAHDQICVTARFAAGTAAPPLSAGGNVVADGVEWRDANIVIEAEDALEVVVSNADVRSTRIELRGPITLRFQDMAALEGVSISSNARSAVVGFDRVQPKALIVGDAEHRFAGHLEARHSAFTASSFVLESIELDSVVIDGAFLASTDLVANDGSLHDVTMDLGDATFAPTEMLAVDIKQCETLSFFGSNLRNVLVPRCSGDPTRLYTTDLVSGRLDGEISGDGSKLEQVHLGLNEPSRYELWAVTVVSSAFCGHVEDVKVSKNAVMCSSCSEGALETLETACTLPLGDFERPDDDREDVIQNFCEPLNMLEPCPPPVPMRTRPIGTLD